MLNGKRFALGDPSSPSPQLRLFHSVVAPFRRQYQEHRHTAFELSLICAGKGIYRAGDSTYSFSAGDVFLFSTNEAHCIVEVSSGEPLDILNLQFEPRFLWSPENLLLQIRYPDIFFNRNPQFSHRLSVQPVYGAEIGRRIRGIETEFIDAGTDYRLMVKLLVLELLVIIRRDYSDFFSLPTGNFPLGSIRQMEKALDYIDRNLTDPLQLEQVANEVGMSPSYFSSLFKKLNGVPLWDYVQSRRIELAVEKLCSTDQPIAQIALDCGYNSISNFNRSFKSVTSMTPKEYRRNHNAERPQ